MKFGRNLPRNQVPEWSAEYINYKALKKLIKGASEELKAGNEGDLATFFFSVDRNVETVDSFYNRKYAEVTRRLKLLNDRYGPGGVTIANITKEEVEDLIGLSLELRSQSRKLQWYGEVNRRGFIKILKKLDKKVPTACAQHRYISSRVDPKPFATNLQLIDDVNTINHWLANLGDYIPPDDETSPRSSISLSRATSTTALVLPIEIVDGIDRAIRKHNVQCLQKELEQTAKYEQDNGELVQRLLLHSLQRAISCESRECMKILLARITTLDEPDDISKRGCIHRLVIAIGRVKSSEVIEQGGLSPTLLPKNYSIIPAEAPNLQDVAQALVETDANWVLNDTDTSVALLAFLLDQLPVKLRPALVAGDIYGRLPLHYAAKYGFASMCKVILNRMSSWGQFSAATLQWQDLEGNSPVYYSVVGGHPITTSLLLDCFTNYDGDDQGKCSLKAEAGRLLLLATKANFVNIVRALLRAGADVNLSDSQGETALHLAARFGQVECAKALLGPLVRPVAKLNMPENTFGWTPLLMASVDGQLPMVELLVDAGVDIEKVDVSGWTAAEHAALRGHNEIATLLSRRALPGVARKNGVDGCSDSPPKHESLSDRVSRSIAKDNNVRNVQSLKSFGHRYLTKDSLILVSLGSMDPRKDVKPVKLDNVPLAEAHATQLDTALSVIVSASGATGEPIIIDLPVQDNISTEPIAFYTSDVTKVKLLFDIVPTYAGSQEKVVGRGVALLSSVKQHIGSKRMNLQGDISVPIVAAKNLDFIGVVNFNFLVITPFSHPNMSIAEDRTYWKKTEPLVIGHRGLGKNTSARKSLQLGENTIQSFIAAANLGASYVEFDVQLTKDHVPIIYHDFLVSETGIDAPVHTLTLEQFLHVSDLQTPRHSRQSSPVRNGTIGSGGEPRNGRRQYRANSLGAPSSSTEMSERMKHTRDFKLQGYKGNSRGTFIQAPFATLEEMFRCLPQSIGFNIEMKYPMLFETEDHDMDTYAVELNSFVDTVLTMVYDLSKGRDIIFSSFHPDVCLLLSFKQPSIPILFLTDAGASTTGDIRASSLQEAIRFASRWNLLGIVSAALPFVTCPRLVRVVKESGLVCVSYGTLNNDPANVKIQVNQGIDAVIVDSVLAIRKGLTHPEPPKTVAEAKEEELTINGVPISSFAYGAVF